MEIRTPHRW